MTMMMYFVAPMMVGGPMDVAGALGDMLGGSWMMGMYRVLPGAPWLKGSAWGLALWLILQAVVTPMMGGGMFSSASGGLVVVMASLIAHVLYGALLGVITGSARAALATPPAPAARMAR